MIGSGRCHGPNCTREAPAGFWCSERCFGVWQWAKSRREIADLAPMDETHVWGPQEIAAAGRLTRPEWRPTLAKADLLVDTSAAKPQVASGEPVDTNPQVADNNSRSEHVERGWLTQAFHRLFGRTT